MRITSEMMVSRSLDRLSERIGRYERAQSQLATGRRMLAPSDDPAATRRAMSLRAAITSREQEKRNADDADSWLQTADSQLQAGLERIRRVRDLAVQGASEIEPAQRAAISREVASIAEELHAIANTRHQGQPLFGGYAGGDAVVRDPVTGTWTSSGDGDAITRRVTESEHVRVNVTAAEVFGFGAGDDLFTVLEQLSSSIATGPGTAVSGDLARLDVASGRVADALATVGANANRVASAVHRTHDLLHVLRTELSEVEDVDMTAAVMDMQVQQVAYEAALQTLAKALPPSLVTFLR